jgi:hypothetical protein
MSNGQQLRPRSNWNIRSMFTPSEDYIVRHRLLLGVALVRATDAKHRIINVAITDLAVFAYDDDEVSNISLIEGSFHPVPANLSSRSRSQTDLFMIWELGLCTPRQV